MQAAVLNTSIDYEAWLAVNTAFCKRHRCRLTLADCDLQRRNSQGTLSDLRCQGCAGLDNQPEAVDEFREFGKARPLLQLVRPIIGEDSRQQLAEKEAPGEETSARISEQAERETCLDGGDKKLARELQRIFLEEDDPAMFDEEIDCPAVCIDDEVLRLFPELREFIEEGAEAGNEGRKGRIAAKSKQHTNKCAVYIGRCKRCNGYMINALERHGGIKDDDVYRCFTCGWRTSPVYQFNRL